MVGMLPLGRSRRRRCCTDGRRAALMARMTDEVCADLASDSPPCACPIDLPRAQALGQELFLGDQKGLPLSSRSKIRANGCRGEAPKRLQSGRPVKPELCRPLPLQPFWDSASCSVIYVLLGLPRSTRFACSTPPAGARI